MEPIRNQDALIEALRLNDAHVRGLTRLDQQLVYVPLVVIAGALYAAFQEQDRFGELNVTAWVWWPEVVIGGLVVAGLIRNHLRHHDLLRHRQALYAALGLPSAQRSIWAPVWLGRVIYVMLFAAAWVGGCWLLTQM